MIARLLNLACCLLFTVAALTQTTDYSKWITEYTIEGKPIKILRIPAEEAPPHLKMDIISIQRDLDRNRKWYEEGQRTVEGSVIFGIQFIEHRDTSFPLQYYQNELDAFLAYNMVQKERESIALTQRAKRWEDSIHLEKLKEGYTWISADTVSVRTKPDLKAAPIGKLHRLSYVKSYVVEGQPDWAEVEFATHSGYILKRYLALTWEEMALTTDELDELKSGRFFSFDATSTYQAKLNKITAAEAQSVKAANAPPPGRKLYRGPKGGCYFINSHGNKEYVDRSLCR